MVRWAWLGVLVVMLAMTPGPAHAADSDAVVQVWESGGLSPMTVEATRVVASAQGARLHVRWSGSLRLMGVTRRGADVQRPAAGFGYPMATLGVDRTDPLIPAASALSTDAVLMSERSAALRRARAGDVLEVEGWNREVLQLRIARVVPDEELDWYEMVLSDDTAERLGFDRRSALVLEGAPAARVRSALAWLIRSPTVRFSTGGAPVAFSDITLPTVVVKERFGEFAFRPTGRGDGIEIEQAWLDANIVDAYVDGLGPFRCNRAVLPYLRSAIDDLRRQGLLQEVDYDDFQIAGGCFNSRMMRGGDKGYALSRHAWGIAIDINPSANPYGGPTRLSADFGDVFRRWGFSWGATWTVPDGMHFEWSGVPSEVSACSDIRLIEPLSSSVTWSVEARPGSDCPAG